MSDEVWGHLEGHWPVPGLHRYIRARAGETVEAIDAVVRAGEHLLPSGCDGLASKVGKIGRAVELHGVGEGGGGEANRGAVLCDQIARFVTEPEPVLGGTYFDRFQCQALVWVGRVAMGKRPPWSA